MEGWRLVDDSPWLMRGEWQRSKELLVVQFSDLSSVWQCQLSGKDLLQQKEKYDQTFEVASAGDLAKTVLEVIRSPRSGIKVRVQGDWVYVNATLYLDIFPFLWKFFLFRTETQSLKVTLDYFLKPTLKALATAKQHNRALQAALDAAQTDLAARMTEADRKLFKKHVPKVEQQQKINVFKVLQDIPCCRQQKPQDQVLPIEVREVPAETAVKKEEKKTAAKEGEEGVAETWQLGQPAAKKAVPKKRRVQFI